MLAHPVELLPSIQEAVAAQHRIVWMTKGVLFHQERKIDQSGGGCLFHRIEIVSEKDAQTYTRVIDDCDAHPSRFAIVGNSLRSDIEPVIGLGGWGIHMPYHVTLGSRTAARRGQRAPSGHHDRVGGGHSRSYERCE